MFIIEAIVGGVTVITCSSLWFANAITKRMHEETKDDKKENQKELTHFELLPYLEIYDSTPCPFCNSKWKNSTKDTKYGVSQHSACELSTACIFDGTPHLHAQCRGCNSVWAMKPGIAKRSS